MPRFVSVVVPVVFIVVAVSIAVVLGLLAVEIRRVVRATGTSIHGGPRIGAERPGPQDTLRGLVIDVLHRDDTLRSDASLGGHIL